MAGKITALAIAAMLATTAAAQATELTVMAYNIWGGGGNESKPIDETVAVIKAAGADIISVSETRLEADPCTADSCPPRGESVAAKLAQALGFHYYDQTASNPAIWANAILSRYPIVKPTKDDLGVSIDVDGRIVYVFSVNLDDAPYQPYQLLNIEYGAAPFFKTADEAIKAAEETRGKSFDALIADANEAKDAAAVFIAGDFNEPSHRDWTDATVTAKLQPLAVAWPGTSKLEAAGFVDTFRTVYPDAAAKPGITWTPTTDASDPEDHLDRIDFVFARAAGLKVISASVVGEKQPEADIVVTPWPSDHRAVVSKVEF
ncbi:MAG: endonuclease/exonuclease/phosphatase family protein [Hyphomicrobiales bacterium]|nr:endonuclease/exonuclease/phosphatase family protein [Hyphomicrobiales bacterium]